MRTMPFRRHILIFAGGITLALCSCGLDTKDAGRGAPSDLGFKGTVECVAFDCHPPAAASWAAGAHGNPDGDPAAGTGDTGDCASCHDPAGDRADAAYLFTPGSPLGPAPRPVAGCEGCHGSGSEHYAYAGTLLVMGEHRAPLASTISPMFPNPFAAGCGCHTSTLHAGPAAAGASSLLVRQHPEWWGVDGPSLAVPDGHSDSLVVRTHEGRMTSLRAATPCAACHTVEGFVRIMVRGEAALASSQTALDRMVCETGDTGLSPPRRVPGPDALPQVSCVSCHPSHEAGSLLRDLPDVSGASLSPRLCFSCHQTLEIPAGEEVPHGTQREIFLGSGGYEFAGFPPEARLSDHSGTFNLPGGCVACHYRVVDDAPLSAYPRRVTTGHSFRARVDACRTCHPKGDALLGLVTSSGAPDAAAYSYTSISSYSFSNARLAGAGEPLAAEIAGLLADLKGHLSARGAPWDNPRQVFDLAAMPAADSTLRGAAWNYDLVARDRSHGFHNPLYVRNLLAFSLSALH
jgi:hypothetical protein